MTLCVSWQFAIPQDNATSTAHDNRAIAPSGRIDTPPKKRRSMVEPSQLVVTPTIPVRSHFNPVKPMMIGIFVFPPSLMQASDGPRERLFATFPRPFFAKRGGRRGDKVTVRRGEHGASIAGDGQSVCSPNQVTPSQERQGGVRGLRKRVCRRRFPPRTIVLRRADECYSM